MPIAQGFYANPCRPEVFSLSFQGKRGEKQIREEIYEYMLGIEVCKNILKEDGLRLNDSQVKEVRDFLYAIAHIELRALNNNEKENEERDSYGN